MQYKQFGHYSMNNSENACGDSKYINKNLIKYEVSEEFLTMNRVEFVKGETIATGTFGTIYSGLSKNTGAIVAIKQIKMDSKTNQKLIKQEIKKLSKIDHPNLLKYIGVQCNESNNDGMFFNYSFNRIRNNFRVLQWRIYQTIT